MIKQFILLFISCALAACNSSGSKKTKNIVELTPKLVVEEQEPILINSSLLSDDLVINILKNKPITITDSPLIAEPCVVNSILYGVNAKGKVFAFDLKAQKLLWLSDITNKSHNQYIGGGIVYNAGKLYIANGSRFLVVLDSSTGNEVVRKELPDIIRIKPVILEDQIILLQTISNQLFAYNVVTSNVVWQHEGMLETLSSDQRISPIIHDGYVIVSYNSGQIFALETKTGTEKWVLNLSQPNEVILPSFETVTLACAPIIEGDYIYIASNTNKLLKLYFSTGAVVWTASASDIQSMSLFGNSLFVTNNAKQVAAVSNATGKVKWVADLNSKDKKKFKATLLFSPFITKKGDDWVLNIFNKDGEIYRFQSDDHANLLIPPVIIKTLPNIMYINSLAKEPVYIATDKKIILAN